jgi:nucleoside-diphosphate-sugar epimerase
MGEQALVVGATGLVGMATVKQLAGRGDCAVTAVSRRRPFETYGAKFQSLDLTDARACAELAEQQKSVNRVVYTALYEKPGLIAGWFDSEQIETNLRMLQNLLEPLTAAASDLQHVTLLQGTKAYGAHAGAFPVPAREDRDERRDIANFYWEQEDYLRARQQGARWSWSILRPQIVLGVSFGAAMNLIPAIGVFAALRRERGDPLAFPGGIGPVLEAVDADLLARAIDWAGHSDAARNQVFNVTNGDVFVWENVWPTLADAFGMEIGTDAPERLGESMPRQAAAWDAIRARYELRSPELHAFVGESFHYADFCMAHGSARALPASIVSTVKLRQAGFTEVMDTEVMFRKWIRHFQHERLLPPR